MKNKVTKLKNYLGKIKKLTDGYLDLIVFEMPVTKQMDKNVNKLCIGIVIAENKISRTEMIYVPLVNILKK